MKTITAEELKELFNKDEILLIDVREPEEHRIEHIDGDHLISLGEISLEKLSSKSKPIVMYCRSGKRSVYACLKLLEEDQTLNVYSLDGGIIAWRQAGFDSKKL